MQIIDIKTENVQIYLMEKNMKKKKIIFIIIFIIVCLLFFLIENNIHQISNVWYHYLGLQNDEKDRVSVEIMNESLGELKLLVTIRDDAGINSITKNDEIQIFANGKQTASFDMTSYVGVDFTIKVKNKLGEEYQQKISIDGAAPQLTRISDTINAVFNKSFVENADLNKVEYRLKATGSDYGAWQTSDTFTGLTPGIVYYGQTKYRNSDGSIIISLESTAPTDDEPGYVLGVHQFTAKNLQSDADKGIDTSKTMYRLRSDTDPYGEWQNTELFDNLTQKVYYLQSQSVDNAGNITYSQEKTVNMWNGPYRVHNGQQIAESAGGVFNTTYTDYYTTRNQLCPGSGNTATRNINDYDDIRNGKASHYYTCSYCGESIQGAQGVKSGQVIFSNHYKQIKEYPYFKYDF